MLNTYANVILKRDHHQKEERHNNGHLSKLHSKIGNKYPQGYVFISFVVWFSFSVRPGSIDPMTAVVPRVKGFAYYSLSFSRHNKNIKMEHFFLYILSRYFIWLHKWKRF